MNKQATAVGSATPDPEVEPAAASPVPPIRVANKPAPGQKGPAGMAPRTSYSRVNTGTPPVPDAGGFAQKSAPPRGLEFLPRKIAQAEDHMTTNVQARISINEMLKAAMAGTASKVDTNLLAKEASIQQGNQGVDPEPELVETTHGFTSVPTEYVHKMASALDFISASILKEADGAGPVAVGKGPNTLEVLQATSSEENIDAGESGRASGKNQPPKVPATQTEEVQSGKANTGLQDNASMSHPEQPTDPWNGKTASADLFAQNLARLGVKVASGPKLAAPAPSSAPVGLIRKLAEDAINPAKISGGTHDAAKAPEGASAAEQDVPSEPADVNKQKAMISSNDSAINYKKREAKADPKSDVNKVLSENAQTKATDKVLHRTLDHTEEAGAKISSANQEALKVAAARALLTKVAAEVAEEKKKNPKKEKGSMVDPTPQGHSGFSAQQMGGGAMPN